MWPYGWRTTKYPPTPKKYRKPTAELSPAELQLREVEEQLERLEKRLRRLNYAADSIMNKLVAIGAVSGVNVVEGCDAVEAFIDDFIKSTEVEA